MLYHGNSMNPLFESSDTIEVDPYIGQGVLAGDVVVFRSTADGKPVAHRVISVSKWGIRTRGDNNFYKDPWLLDESDLIGRVVSFTRGGVKRPVARGLKGRLQIVPLRAYISALKVMGLFIRPACRRFSKVRSFLRLGFRMDSLSVISLERPKGNELLLLRKGRVIGRLRPGDKAWEVRPPYRLFIDMDALQKYESMTAGWRP